MICKAFLYALLLFSSVTEASLCSELLVKTPDFWVEGRRITIPLQGLVIDLYGLFGGSHVIYVKGEPIEARFLDSSIEAKANLAPYEHQTSGYFVSGFLAPKTADELIIEIDRVWKKTENTKDLDFSETPKVIELNERR